MQHINRVVLTGNLTRDPELRQTAGGTTVCQLRVAVNARAKQQGEWVDKANFFDVVCFGAQADNVAKFLAKGRALAVDGRLDWREWEADGGQKRQAVQIIADSIQFLSDGNRDGDRGHSPATGGGNDVPVTTSDFERQAPAAAAVDADEDIPF